MIKGSLGGQIACWKRDLENEVDAIKQQNKSLEVELNVISQLLKVSEGKYDSLEREFHLLKEDRDAALQRISQSSQMLVQMNAQKEKAVKDFNTEVRMRKRLVEEVKQFSIAFASRQRSLISFQSDFKSILDSIKAQNPTSLSKSHGS